MMGDLPEQPAVMVLGLDFPGLQAELEFLERRGVRVAICTEEVRKKL